MLIFFCVTNVRYGYAVGMLFTWEMKNAVTVCYSQLKSCSQQWQLKMSGSRHVCWLHHILRFIYRTSL